MFFLICLISLLFGRYSVLHICIPGCKWLFAFYSLFPTLDLAELISSNLPSQYLYFVHRLSILGLTAGVVLSIINA